jgi:hypothetical protein
MSLADELVELRSHRSTGRIGPVEYYQSLARLIDASPDASPDQSEVILTCVRRIEALLKDRLGASLQIESSADRIPPDLRIELRDIATSHTALARGETLSPVEISGLHSRCDCALLKTLHLAETADPPDPSLRIKAQLPPRALRGVVWKVRHSQRSTLPGWRFVQNFAVMDIDGRLEVIHSGSPLQIESGDRLVVAGFADHELVLYCNESRPAGNKRKNYETTVWVLAALGVLVILAGGVVVCIALIRAVHSHWNLTLIMRCSVLALAGVLTSWVGLWFAVMMRQMARLVRAFDGVL